MSSDKILNLFKDFENIKYLYLNNEENELFDSMRSLTLDEHLSKIEKLNHKKLNCIEINDLIEKIDDKE